MTSDPLSPDRSVDARGLETGPVLYPLDRIGIELTGDDRFQWLNGMLTSDLRNLEGRPRPTVVYGCALDRKGKLLADAIVTVETTEAEPRLTVWLPSASVSAVIELWDRAIVMEDVSMAARSHRLVSVQGQGALAVVQGIGTAGTVVAYDDLGFELLDETSPGESTEGPHRAHVPQGSGQLLVVEADQVAPILSRAQSRGTPVIDERTAQRLRVVAGRATYGAEVSEANYVQEAGWTDRAVSFSKGCYLGQEVVCMLQMRGHVSRRLTQLWVSPAAQAGLTAGAEVREGDAGVGKVASTVTTPEGVFALALLKYGTAPKGSTVQVGEDAAVVLGDAR